MTSPACARPADTKLPRKLSFDADDWLILASYWHPIALVRELEDKPLGVTLLDAPLVVYRAGEEIVVADDLCPHRGVPLSMGKGNGQTVACAYHGFQFGHQGRCVRVPAHPNNAIPSRLNLRTYPVVERYGLIDPDAIVLGGGVSNLSCLYERVPDAMKRYVITPECKTELLKNKHGDSSGVRGAAWLWG